MRCIFWENGIFIHIIKVYTQKIKPIYKFNKNITFLLFKIERGIATPLPPFGSTNIRENNITGQAKYCGGLKEISSHVMTLYVLVFMYILRMNFTTF